MKNNGQVGAGLDAAPPAPLTTAATASTSSQVSDPHGGLTKAAAARFPGLVPSHFVGQGSGYTTGGVSDTTQPAAVHAAARNLDSELRSAVPPDQPAATRTIRRRVDQCADYSPPWSAGTSSGVGLQHQQRLPGQAAESSSSLSAVQLFGPTQ